MSSARAKQPPNRANSTPNISARGAADGSGRRVSEPHNAGRRISETTVINADARMHHALPTLQSTGHSSITDYMTPTSARGVEASKRLGVKRDNRLSVSVRIRPMNKADNNVSEVAVHPEGMFNIKLARPGGGDALAYAFDNVFVGGQDEVYDCIGKPMLQNAYEGYNVTLFAYGQTGSGKTHSILGPDGTLTHNSPKEEGFVPRFCKALLGYAQVRLAEEATLSLRITMSMVEVYNEEVCGPAWRRGGDGPPPCVTVPAFEIAVRTFHIFTVLGKTACERSRRQRGSDATVGRRGTGEQRDSCPTLTSQTTVSPPSEDVYNFFSKT